MLRVRVESRSIRSIGYDPKRSTLEIEFQHGRIYQYFDVPRLVHEQLMAASSKGAGFQEFVREAGFDYLRVK